MADARQEALNFKVSGAESLDERQVVWVEEMRTDRDFTLELRVRQEGKTTAMRAAVCLALKAGQARLLCVSMGRRAADLNAAETIRLCEKNGIVIHPGAGCKIDHDNGSMARFVPSKNALAALREMKAGFPVNYRLVIALDEVAQFDPEVCAQLRGETWSEPLVPTVTWSVVGLRDPAPAPADQAQ